MTILWRDEIPQFQERSAELQIGFPGFPVESCGFGQLHVVLFRENHISGLCREP
jgi:hypothetical protein